MYVFKSNMLCSKQAFSPDLVIGYLVAAFQAPESNAQTREENIARENIHAG